jgi:pilus assembly protein Flp/PilA
MTPETLSEIAGVALALAFAYFPGLKSWFEQQPGERKASIAAGTAILAALAIFGLSCVRWFGLTVACNQTGIEELVRAVGGALIALAGGYITLVKPFKSALASKPGSQQEGQGLIEYALILVLIAVVVIVVLALVGTQISNIFSQIASALDTGG